ncbi:hypothetical protein PFISCL1PPCAC_22436, partial [Pristionchus fissidentatus]
IGRFVRAFSKMLSQWPGGEVEADLLAAQDGDKVFDETRKKPQVSYRGDGRKEIDGILQESQGANALWTTTISRGVAHQWKDKSEGRIARAQRYISEVTYEAKVYIGQNRYVSIVALIVLNLFLLYILYGLL